MLEPSAMRCLARSLGAGLLGWTLALATFATAAWAGETLPPSVRACSTLTDRDDRLACFDREVASFPDPNAPSQAAKAPRSGAAPPEQHFPPATAASAAAPASAPTSTAPPAASASTSASATAATPPTPAKRVKADPAGRIAARVVSIDRSADTLVLHLDNGEAWEQMQAVSGDLSLKVGDNVTIDKHFGSFWLNGPHVSGMKVRQKT